jgi:pumilio RNA-binding family
LNEKDAVFAEIRPHVYELMQDVFGNYVIQKFFEYGTHEQKTELVMAIKNHVLSLALHMYGCRVIQKTLENVAPEQQHDVINELRGHVLKCVKDQNGNHVIQKIIEKVSESEVQFIVDAIVSRDKTTEKSHVYDMSTHPYGCRVIQRILEHCNGAQCAGVLNEMHVYIKTFVTDQYGNYVVQHVLEHGTEHDKQRIMDAMRGNVLKYSQHKYASNVIERCLREGSNSQRTHVIEEILGEENSNTLEAMMRDQFANYVVQRMFDVADERTKHQMIISIKPHIASLKRYNYGKHIISKLEKWLSKSKGMSLEGDAMSGGMIQANFMNQPPSTYAAYPPPPPPSHMVQQRLQMQPQQQQMAMQHPFF